MEFASDTATTTATTAAAPFENLNDVIDTARYPIEDLDGEIATAFLKSCHASLQADGSCVIPGFIRKEALPTMLAEVSDLEYYHRDHQIGAFKNRFVMLSFVVFGQLLAISL